MVEFSSNTNKEVVSPRLASALEQLGEGVILADETGQIVYVNAAAAELYSIDGNVADDQTPSLIHRLNQISGGPYSSDELPLVRALEHGETVSDAQWRISNSDGSDTFVRGSARPVKNDDGDLIGAVLTLRDETAREAERKALRDALDLKNLLLREIHHRVKNNLQLVSSLLNLQGRKSRDDEAKSALSDLSSRIDIIADIHRALYETGETDTIEIVAYLEQLCRSDLRPLTESFDIDFNVRTSGRCVLPIEKATSLSLAVNELTLGALKRSFDGTSEPQIDISIESNASALTVTFADNGAAPDLDPIVGSETGFGRLLINGLERQLSATVEQAHDDQGFRVKITVPSSQAIVSAA